MREVREVRAPHGDVAEGLEGMRAYLEARSRCVP